MNDGRLIVDPPATGSRNMAVDEALLADAADSNVATLRLYQWNEPTLSLGYFQCYDDRLRHAASRAAAVVRRQSGGGAIVHDQELTYSIALPASHPLARHAEQLYTTVHEAFIAVLTPRIQDVGPRWSLMLRGSNSSLANGAEPFLCFQRRARGDLILIPLAEATVSGHKILGSAQRRRRGAILQHGSLVLRRSAAAPEIVGINDLIDAHLSISDLAVELPVRIGRALDILFKESSLPDELCPLVAQIEARKYAAPGWTKRR